jgi:hypothetical protein
VCCHRSMDGSPSDVKLTMGLAVHVRALAAGECDGKVTMDVLPMGLCR